ncbi:MAG: hypothetical protein JXA69_21440 [Phycisphaerae bacterium]|nr:hypothetical protein [Phycisphaerae bacterium]
MPENVLTIHSLVEAHFYAALAVCPACARCGLMIQGTFTVERAGAPVLGASAGCSHCAAETTLAFDTRLCEPADLQSAAIARMPVIVSRVAEPSAAIDVSQWLTLYRMAVESSEFPSERVLIRAALLEAGACLAEALKFYSPDSDIPPPSAFFSEESRARFAEYSHLFIRDRLLDLASGLPTSVTQPPTPVTRNRPASTKWWLR